MYETLTYTGGIHKHEEMTELIEDLGGFVLQENISQMDLVLTLLFQLKMLKGSKKRLRNFLEP